MIALLRPSAERTDRRRSPALIGSIGVHAAVLIAVFAIAAAVRDDVRDPGESATSPLPPMVWRAIAGPGGGGGGRAMNTPAPPQPVPPPPSDAPARATEPDPTPIPVVDDVPQPLGAETPFDLASTSSIGAIGPPSAPIGDGRGNGSGDGDGKGAGPGKDDGFGDGAFQAGNGVTSPVPLTQASGRYTAEAVLARAQGVISVECVVEPNGQCGDLRVIRAFDPSYGLRMEALNAARRWRFRPGMRNNMPVPVLVRLDIEFRIH